MRTARDLEQARDPLRGFAEHAFSRAAGSPLVAGNRVRLLRDATENFPAWLGAIESAQRSIFFEQYIFADDPLGREFAAMLASKARSGVRVRVLYDWFGAVGERTRRVLQPVAAAGAEVRCFNPPRIESPLGWVVRNHRKSLVVDGTVGFVTGICIAQRWVGDPAVGRQPWRDTGVEVRGPAVSDLGRAFAQTWAEAGGIVTSDDLPTAEMIPNEGDVTLRVIATAPSTAGVYRLDHLIAALARRTLWLTDAYFVGTAAYVQALRAAARDGVDVRFLVPGETDVPLVKAIGRAGYRPLLESGVRVWEWNGPMLHAKTSVADGRWSRVGSSNLNVASWLGNHELDVAVEDAGFAHDMEDSFLADLDNATEIVLSPRRRPAPVRRPPPRPRPLPDHGERRARSGLAAAGALRIGHAVGAAIGGYRVLGPAEAKLLGLGGLVLFAIAIVSLAWPRVAAFPIAVLSLWLSAALMWRAWRLRREAKRRGDPRPAQTSNAEPGGVAHTRPPDPGESRPPASYGGEPPHA
ncbi:MAG TPA: phospholipase D-like domain-containing protein [Anaeromyxobacteraceae bacterium]|nr:phospholipase D-like domain-containing protein [Anaeromyxobacteraceae bacterium]